MGVISCFCLQALEEQISQEESSSQALREEVLAKEQNVLELHTAMKEVQWTNRSYKLHLFPPWQRLVFILTTVF